MRLIDADAFADEMRKRQEAAKAWKQDAKDAETAARADAVLSFLCEVKLALDAAPTVDAEPVRHGRWIWMTQKEAEQYAPLHIVWCEENYRCSECGNFICGNNHLRIKTAYCCSCGAKMDL